MNRNELKLLIKEAVREVLAESGTMPNKFSSNTGPNKEISESRKTTDTMAELIRANMGNNSGNSLQNFLINNLADTAQTTFAKQKEKDSFGYTLEEKTQFDSMFTDDLKEHFNKLFDK